MGFEQGKQNRASIQEAIKTVLDSDIVKENKPKLLPQRLFFAAAKRRAEKLLKEDILENYPKQADRLKGIADGASVDHSSILFIQMMEVLVGCTAMAFPSKMFSGGEPILAKNFDYLNFTEPYNLTCESKPKEGYKTLTCKFTPISGTFDGLNEHGLAVTYNLAFSTDKPQIHVPTSIMLQEMLENCTSTKEAVDFIKRAKRGGHDALITLIDPSEDIKTVELSSNHAAVRNLSGNCTVNTNHYQTQEMQAIAKQPYESSTSRLNRAKELLNSKSTIGEDEIRAILWDHGAQKAGSALTICMHGPLFSTQRSMIIYPKTKTIKILYGHPCENSYSELSLS